MENRVMEDQDLTDEDLEIVELPQREAMLNLLAKLFKNVVHVNAHL